MICLGIAILRIRAKTSGTLQNENRTIRLSLVKHDPIFPFRSIFILKSSTSFRSDAQNYKVVKAPLAASFQLENECLIHGNYEMTLKV